MHALHLDWRRLVFFAVVFYVAYTSLASPGKTPGSAEDARNSVPPPGDVSVQPPQFGPTLPLGANSQQCQPCIVRRK